MKFGCIVLQSSERNIIFKKNSKIFLEVHLLHTLINLHHFLKLLPSLSFWFLKWLLLFFIPYAHVSLQRGRAYRNWIKFINTIWSRKTGKCVVCCYWRVREEPRAHLNNWLSPSQTVQDGQLDLLRSAGLKTEAQTRIITLRSRRWWGYSPRVQTEALSVSK